MKLDPIKSATEAMTLSQQKNDLFYHRAYLIQKWLAMVAVNTLAQYAARPRTYPQMQAGQAFHALTDVFGHVPDCKVPYLAAALLRFSSTDHPFAPLLHQARDLMVPELRHPASGRKAFVALEVAECLLLYLQKETAAPNSDCTPEEEKLVATHFWELIRRWCAWLDCVTHYQAHALFTVVPFRLDPANSEFDPAIITANMDFLLRKVCRPGTGWIWHHRFDQTEESDFPIPLPRVRLTDEGSAARNDPWPLHELDMCLIRLYPLALRHEWSAEDFLTVLRGRLSTDLYFSDEDLRAYCRHSLGLYGLSRKRRPGGQQPPAGDLAPKLCPSARGKEIGNPPWS